MPFIVKDLMISVLGAESPLAGKGCGSCTKCTPCTGSCSPCSSCTGCTNNTPLGFGEWGGWGGWGGGGILPMVQSDPIALTVLKEQLQAVLATVEAQEKAAYEAMRPKTPEEVEQLRARLTAALDELNKTGKEEQ